MMQDEKIGSARIEEMKGGWFIGDFEPSLYKTQDVEVAVKSYKAGESEGKHFHKIATEYTVVTKGRIRMQGEVFGVGDIVIVKPGQATDFTALEDSMTTVVKIPGAKDDKYPY